MRITCKIFEECMQIESIYKDDFDKQAYAIAHVINWHPEKLNNYPPKKYLKLVKKYVNCSNVSIFTRQLNLKTKAENLTFGEFVDIIYWLKIGWQKNFCNIAARLWQRYPLDKLEKAILKISKTNVSRVANKVFTLIDSYQNLVKKNELLFDSINDVENEHQPNDQHPFVSNFGWFFAAESLADYFKEPLDNVYNKNILECFSALHYLKAKTHYINEQHK